MESTQRSPHPCTTAPERSRRAPGPPDDPAALVPGRWIRELRDLTRRRTELTVARGQEIQRLEKELEDTGMKLTSVITNVVGTTGRAIIDALIAGERDPRVLAGLAVGRARKKTLGLVAALDGTFTDHHGRMCRHYLDQIEHLDRLVGRLDQRFADLTAGHDDDIGNLDSLPGVGRRAAEVVLAETGGDMTRFATAGHLASWIGVCPGMNESAGVTMSGRTRSGNANLKRILGVAALAALRDRNSYYGVYYRRIAARRRGKKALVAVMHKLAIAIWHVLHDKTTFTDPGADYFTKRDPERAMKRMIREANSIGLTVRFDPLPQASRAEQSLPNHRDFVSDPSAAQIPRRSGVGL